VPAKRDKYKPLKSTSRKELTQAVTSRALEFMRFVIMHRDRYGISSRKAFAEAIGMSQPALYNVENSPEKNFTVEQLASICKVFGLSPAWLLLGEGEMEPVSKSMEGRLADLEKVVDQLRNTTAS